VVDRSDLNDGAGVPADDDAGAAAGRAGIAVVANVRLDHATRAVYEAIAVHVAEEEDLRADLEAQGELHFLLRMVAQALDALLFREPQVPIAAVSSGVRVGALEREDEWEGERATPAHGEEEDDASAALGRTRSRKRARYRDSHVARGEDDLRRCHLAQLSCIFGVDVAVCAVQLRSTVGRSGVKRAVRR
jgi:hypothetical protein